MAIEWSDGIVVANLADEPALSDELGELTDRVGGMELEKVPSIVLNFGQVTYLNSSNIAQMLKLRKHVGDAGRAMRVCSLNDEVWSVFTVTGLDKVFTFAPDPMTALAGLQLRHDGA